MGEPARCAACSHMTPCWLHRSACLPVGCLGKLRQRFRRQPPGGPGSRSAQQQLVEGQPGWDPDEGGVRPGPAWMADSGCGPMQGGGSRGARESESVL
jgi:hypothetical protein